MPVLVTVVLIVRVIVVLFTTTLTSVPRSAKKNASKLYSSNTLFSHGSRVELATEATHVTAYPLSLSLKYVVLSVNDD